MVKHYVGARYVPKFASPLEWAADTSYEALTIVTFNNASYTSKVPVPPTVGNPANNPQYWALTGNYNAQVEQYRQETENYNAQVEEYRQEAETVSNNLTTEITNRKNVDTTLQSQINQIVAPSGEAPSAAEVQNARIGADGVTYDTLGTAIRSQVNNLKGDIAEKIDNPTAADNNKFPRAKDGNVEWVEQGLPTDEQTAQAVSDWLDAHPEATTTVQDGSLTEAKFSNALKLKAIKDYVTPEMFGAKGDGVTDDTVAVQSMFDFVKNSRIKKVLFTCPVKIKSIDLTNLYYRGLIISSQSSANQSNNSSIIIYGSGEIGFDISGSDGIVFRDISIVGDKTDPPVCLVYASRTSVNNTCSNHMFENVRFDGFCSISHIYNYAGEEWCFLNCENRIPQSSGAEYGIYFTSVNKKGVNSKFATVDNSVTPLTRTEFLHHSFETSNNGVSVYFESDNPQGYSDITVSNIMFLGCYSINRLNSSYKFNDVNHNITFVNCIDESGVQNQTERNSPLIYFCGTNLVNGVTFIGCCFFGIANTPYLYVDCPIRMYSNKGINTYGSGEWVFNKNAEYLTHDYLRDDETFIAIRAKYVSVGTETLVNPSNLIIKNTDTYKQLREHEYVEYKGDPNGTISASMGAILFDTANNTLYFGNGYDPWAWRRVILQSS